VLVVSCARVPCSERTEPLLPNKFANPLILIAVALWSVAIWANWRGWLPAWQLVLVAAALGLGLWMAFRRWRRDEDPADALLPWRAYRVVTRYEVQAGVDGLALTIDLARGAETGADTVRLCFRDVARLREAAQGANDLVTDGLRCVDRGVGRGGLRYEVHDRWRQCLTFRCRSFDVVEPEPVVLLR